ncbi:PucR family transcriptional regulator [uncultured Microbacterium sp.]|uniref:PucR family transcriptional regulator n=1 Tax=uncultured Microbacterium sp. TaxID=191216 RepID=UPI0028D3100F|nr:PucR family transcriptional regulator [uncultured Microbacterium sp.]
MPATLASLLTVPTFHLAVAAGVGDVSVLERDISWVHSSDLADPTPWLESGQLLLTDGTQFVGDPLPRTYDDYVHRLLRRDVIALGFATQVAHQRIPEALIDTCERLGMPLLEVKNRTPFMAIIRHVADVTSADQRERLEWLITAQRAVARAALRPDGLDVILRELERLLDCWIELYDARGARVHAGTKRRVPDTIEQQVTSGARETLRKGVPAGMRVDTTHGGATLQTLGQRGRLLGVLAVGTPAPLDPAEADLVSSVISLASIALEQSRALLTARLRVRAGMLELLLAGIVHVADDTAKRLWGPLPAAPLRVAVVEHFSSALLADLELRAERSAGRLFFAERDGELVIVSPDGDPALAELLTGHVTEAGVSSPIEWLMLQRGIAEAQKALACTLPSRPVVQFESLAEEGVLGLLEASSAELVAARMLEPILRSPNPDHQLLLRTAAVWVDHNGAWDPAARKLGIHRHTLRNRLQAVERMLSLDLSRFGDRAQLWAALQYADYPGKLRRG